MGASSPASATSKIWHRSVAKSSIDLPDAPLRKSKATSGKDCPVLESGCSDQSPGMSTSTHVERLCHVHARLCAGISSAADAIAHRRCTLGSVYHDWGEATSL